MVLRQNLQDLNERHAEPTNGAAPVISGRVRGWIGPGLAAALIVRVPKQTSSWIIKVLIINQQLFRNFVIAVRAVAEHLSVTSQKRKRHEDAVSPKLPLATLSFCVPEPAIFGARIGGENFSDVVSGEFVFFLFRFLIKNQQKIAGQHIIECIDRSIDCAFVVDVQIDPGLNVIKITLVFGSEVNEIDAIQIKRLCIPPTFQRISSRITLHRRFDHRNGPIS